MKAIIIEEERFTEVTDLMKAAAMKMQIQRYPSFASPEVMKLLEGLPPNTFNILVQDIHRAIHYEFVRWAQSHGASCTAGR